MFSRPGFASGEHNGGFTVVELAILLSALGILVAISATNYQNAKQRSFDDSMQAALREAMVVIEDYRIANEKLPEDLASLQAHTPLVLSPGVHWERFELASINGIETINLAVYHEDGAKSWRASYPALGNRVVSR